MLIAAGEVNLEAVLWEPKNEAPVAAAVLCHPHPLYGGTMNNRVIDFDFLLDDAQPSLLIVGTRDEFRPRDKMEAFARRLPTTSAVQWVDGADHFFTPQIDEVQVLVRNYLRAQFKGTQE
jgi:alpha/beta superfamily hydrolase